MVRTEGRGGAGRSVYKSVAAWRVETKASGGGSGRFRCQRALRGEGKEDDREWKGRSRREGVGRVCSASAAPSDLALGGRDLRRCARVGELVQSRRLRLLSRRAASGVRPPPCFVFPFASLYFSVF